METTRGLRHLVLGLWLAAGLACQSGQTTAPTSDTTVADISDTTVADTSEDTALPPPDTTPPPQDTAPSPEDTTPLADTWKPPVFPDAPTPLSLGEPAGVSQTPISEGPATVVSAIQGGRILSQDTDGTHLFDVVWSTLEGDFGVLLQTADWEVDTLLACDKGLKVLHKGYLFESPIQALVPDEAIHTIRTVASDGAASVWIGTDAGLYSWEAGTLFELLPEGLPTANAQLTDGAPYNGIDAVWVAAEGWLYAMFMQEGELVSVAVHDALPVSTMSVDSEKRLWLLSDGNVVLRHPNGQWKWWAFSEPVQALYGAAHSKATWFVLADSVVLHQYGVFHVAEGLMAPADADIAEDATLVAATDAGILKVSPDPLQPPEVITWGKHIQLIYNKKCAHCHSPDNIAVDLGQMQIWIDKIDIIMKRVQDDMPADKPPLDAGSVALIQQWIDGGFAE